jgi:HD superfamily phosphodiesterase
MAIRLAKHAQDEQLDVYINIFVVEIAALFHDLFECVQKTRYSWRY